MPSLHTVLTTYGRFGYASVFEFLIRACEWVDQPHEVAHVKAWAVEIMQNLPQQTTGDQLAALQLIMGNYVAQPAGFQGNGFIDGGPLAFVHADRAQLAFELITRVFQPIRIRQRSHPICGAVVLMQDVCTHSPSAYVQYVIDLATLRDARIGPALNNLHVHVRQSSAILTKGFAQGVDAMAQADYIALVGLRNSENMLPYRSALPRLLTGGTSTDDTMGWMRRVGYAEVRDRTLTRFSGAIPSQQLRDRYAQASLRPHLLRMAAELLAGRTVFMIGSSALSDVSLDGLRIVTARNRIVNALGGHVVRALSVAFDQGGVRFRLVTWGRESAEQHLISWSKLTSWYRGYVVGTP